MGNSGGVPGYTLWKVAGKLVTFLYGENEMLESIAFIGYGFVGKACHKAFEHNTTAIIIDPAYSHTTIADLVNLKPPLVFISINAPTLDDRSVDASVIYSIFQQLIDIDYAGLVVLKSTLPPAIVHDLYIKFGRDRALQKVGPLRYIYSPEFIREAYWEQDAVDPSMIIIAGDYHDCKELEVIYKRHSHVKHARFVNTDYREAALAKYAINAYLASKVVFMNQIYELYLDVYVTDNVHPQTWDDFVEILTTEPRFGISHTQVPGPDGKFGYGGTCFPKDIKAMIGFDKKERLSVLRETEIANTKIRLTGKPNPT
jgi:UDPglucose 6-dehydrogenase